MAENIFEKLKIGRIYGTVFTQTGPNGTFHTIDLA